MYNYTCSNQRIMCVYTCVYLLQSHTHTSSLSIVERSEVTSPNESCRYVQIINEKKNNTVYYVQRQTLNTREYHRCKNRWISSFPSRIIFSTILFFTIMCVYNIITYIIEHEQPQRTQQGYTRENETK